MPIADAWRDTCKFWHERDPREVEKADADPKHKMALVFRSYLGQSSGWANQGEPSRKADYQIWCGPSMGAFNEWVRGAFLEAPDGRDVVTVGMNLLVGAAVMTRAGWLRAQGVVLPATAARFAPRQRDALAELMASRENE